MYSLVVFQVAYMFACVHVKELCSFSQCVVLYKYIHVVYSCSAVVSNLFRPQSSLRTKINWQATPTPGPPSPPVLNNGGRRRFVQFEIIKFFRTSMSFPAWGVQFYNYNSQCCIILLAQCLGNYFKRIVGK